MISSSSFRFLWWSYNRWKIHQTKPTAQNIPFWCFFTLKCFGSWLGRPRDQLCDLCETIIPHYSQRTNFVNYLRQLSGIILLCPLHRLQMVALSYSLRTSSAKIYTRLYALHTVLDCMKYFYGACKTWNMEAKHCQRKKTSPQAKYHFFHYFNWWGSRWGRWGNRWGGWVGEVGEVSEVGEVGEVSSLTSVKSSLDTGCFLTLGLPLKYQSTEKVNQARLGVSRTIYVNVDSPNLGFPYLTFQGRPSVKNTLYHHLKGSHQSSQ